MEILNKDVMGEIFKKLTGKEILALCSTSKQLFQICSDDPKFESLWRLKIQEEFGEVYMKDSPFQQYKYLVKLHNQSFYAVYFGNVDIGSSLIGVYDIYGKAVMEAMETVKQHLEEENITISVEALRYLLWNKSKIRFLDYYKIEILKFELRDDLYIFDETKFFREREKIFIDLFLKIAKDILRKFLLLLINPFSEKGRF